MEAKITPLLKEYGLSQKEIKTYLTIVGSVELTAYSVAKKDRHS